MKIVFMPVLSVAVASTKFPLLHVAKIPAPATDHAEEEDTPNANLESKGPPNLKTTRTMLCLSNGHGEDSIAASILIELLVYHLSISKGWRLIFDILLADGSWNFSPLMVQKFVHEIWESS